MIFFHPLGYEPNKPQRLFLDFWLFFVVSWDILGHLFCSAARRMTHDTFSHVVLHVLRFMCSFWDPLKTALATRCAASADLSN